MQELQHQLKKSIEDQLVPFLKKYDFEFHLSVHEHSDTHDLFTFTKGDLQYIEIYHAGFNTLDAPWRLSPILGNKGFKQSTAQFDSIPLWYWKQKISPQSPWQCEAIKLTVDHFFINNIDEIKRSVSQVVFDLDNFCKDFLTGDFSRFNTIREIKYLEHLAQLQVLGEYYPSGEKKFTVYQNKQIE